MLFFPSSLFSITTNNLLGQIATTLVNNLNFSSFNFNPTNNNALNNVPSSHINFESSNISSETSQVYSQIDSSSNFRNNLFANPVISYDFKLGNYLGI